MLSETLGVKSSKGVDRKKKVSIKGVLNKDELAEVYNCDIKKGRKHRSSVPNLQALQPAVKAVDFQEAQLEDLLPDIIQQEKQGPLKRPQSSHNFIEAVRRVSHVEQNNNTIISKSSSTNLFNLSNRETTPAGYEPENSLRRASAVSRPPQLQLKNRARRHSALDKPTFAPQSTQISEEAPAAGYEPDNSLRRVRRTNDQRKPAESRQRDQISPLTLNPEVRFTLADESDSEQSSNSPTTPQTTQRKPVFTLSIPEDEAVKGSCPPTTPSPRYRRKVSLTSPAFRTEAFDKGSQSTLSPNPTLKRQISSPSLKSMPTRTRKTSLDNQRTSNSIKTGNRTSPRNSSGVKLNELDFKKTNGEKSPLNIRAKRYWERYVLSASYSWESFNTGSYYCY